jgi:hypothetical protein
VSSGLRQFWFEFDLPYDVACPRGTREGVGVTAANRLEALEIVRTAVFREDVVPPLRREVADVEIHRLCPWLVLPNMTDPSPRGVWFPIGYNGARR